MPPKVAAYKKIAAARATQAAAAARAARRAEAQGLLQQQGTAADPIVIAGNDRPGDQADVCNPSGHGSSDVVMGGGVDSGDDVHRDSDSESESDCGYEGGVNYEGWSEGEDIGEEDEEAYDVLDELLQEIDEAGLLIHEQRIEGARAAEEPALVGKPKLTGALEMLMAPKTMKDWQVAENGIKG